MSVVLLERKNVKFVAQMKQCMICQSKRAWLKLSDEVKIASPCPRWLFLFYTRLEHCVQFFSVSIFVFKRWECYCFRCTSFSNEVFCISSSAEIPSCQSCIPNNNDLHKSSQIMQFVLLMPHKDNDTHLKYYPSAVRSWS